MQPAQSKAQTDFQILLSYRTHRQVKQAFPNYDTENSPVPAKEIHDSLMLADFSDEKPESMFRTAKGVGIFIPNDITYNEYLQIVEYSYKNPLSKKVFDKMREEIQKELRNA